MQLHVSHRQTVYTNPVTLLSFHNYSSMSTKHVRRHVTFIFSIVRERDRGLQPKAPWAAIEETNLAERMFNPDMDENNLAKTLTLYFSWNA